MSALFFLLFFGMSAALKAQYDFSVIDMRSGLPETRIRTLSQMPDGRMAIATAGTLTIYDGTRFTVYHLRPENEYPIPDYHGERQLTCDSTGLVWLRNDGRLYVIDTRKQQAVGNVDSLLETRSLSATQISAWPLNEEWKKSEDFAKIKSLVREELCGIVHDSYGGVWVGLKESGLLYSNPARKQQFHTSNKPFGFDSQFPFCSPRASQLSTSFAPSATNCTLDGRTIPYTFLGTREGIMIIDRENHLVATLDHRDGLSKNNVVALLSDCNGDVWAATANGLTRIHQAGKDSFDIVNYGAFDGIDTEGREFRTCQIHSDSTGLITVGFVGGTVVFHPDSVNAPRYTFHFPRELFDTTDTQTTSSHRWIMFSLLIGCILLSATILLRRSSHKDRERTAGKQLQTENERGSSIRTAISQHVVEEKLADSNEDFLSKLKSIIEQNISNEDFSVQSLSEMMAMDRTVLYRRMQALTGVAPSVYIKNIRIDVAKQLLGSTEQPVSDIAMKTGFSTTKYFTAAFKDAVGITPNEYRTILRG